MAQWIASHRKTLVVVAGLIVGVVGALVGVDSTYYNAIVAVLTAIGVYGVPNAAVQQG